MPSVKRMAKRATLATKRTSSSPGLSGTRWRLPSPTAKPATRKSTAVEITLRRASSEKSVATTSLVAKTSTKVMPGTYPVATRYKDHLDFDAVLPHLAGDA